MKIFCIGLNKTGTSSLNEALKILGINSVHDTELNRTMMKELRRKKFDTYGMYDAFTESEALYQNWHFLANMFPTAKFILTKRNLKDWVNSRIVHILHIRLTKPGHDWQDIDTAKDAKLYHTHYANVASWFSDSDRLLTIDVCAGQGWNSLCPFVDAPVPDVPFPFENTSNKRLEEIMARFTASTRKHFL